MTFTIGEKVVYPNYGVGVIENISMRSFGSLMERFYLLRLSAKCMTVMVPFSHVDHVGLRRITKNGDLARVLMFLSHGKCLRCSDWKNRFKENTEKMRSGNLPEVAEVLKCLLLQQVDKPLSFREKKMLDRARHMLVTELSISRSISVMESEETLGKALGKASLSLPQAL